MKFSIRSLLLLVLAAAVAIAAVQWYFNYQEWQNAFELMPIFVRLRDSQSSDITHPSATNFIIASSTDADSVWLNLNFGYFNRAGQSSGTGWGWMAMPKITSSDTDFGYELHDSDFSHISPNAPFPQTKCYIKHSQPASRISLLEVTVDLIDSTGKKLDTMTKTITISDTPHGTNGG